MKKCKFMFLILMVVLPFNKITHAAGNSEIILKTVCLEALGNIGEDSSAEIAGMYLEDNEFMVRSSAIYALAKIGGDKAVSLLRNKVKNPDDKRIAVQASAGLFFNSDTEGGKLFESAFSDIDASVCLEAVNMADKLLIKESVPYLISLFKKNNNNLLRTRIIETLCRLRSGKEEIGDIAVKTLNDYDPRLRNAATVFLGVIADKKYTPAVRKMLCDKDDFVAASARLALARTESSLEGIPDCWESKKYDMNSPLHIADIQAFAVVLDTSVIPQVIEDLKNPDSCTHLRVSAIEALKQMRNNFNNDLFSRVIVDENKFGNIKGNIEFVPRIDNKTITEFFIDAIKDSASKYHNDAPIILAMWGDKISSSTLLQALNKKNESQDFIVSVIYALGLLQEKAAVERIKDFLLKK